MRKTGGWLALVVVASSVLICAPIGCAVSEDAKNFNTVDATTDSEPVLPGLIQDAQLETSIADGGGALNDGEAVSDAENCAEDAGGPGPVQRICIHVNGDGNECDGLHDLIGFVANGQTGNGYDDDCDGLVDEGCDCGPGVGIGTTKECFLVPASQTITDVGAPNGRKPAGWCGQNSKGTVECSKATPEAKPTWSGQCRGAQPPFTDDICANGDFDCDGKELNSKTHDCKCKPGTVQCPTDPLTTTPYPNPSNLPLKVDAASWFTQRMDIPKATGWKWTMRGGDCDNILPHPSFGIYTTNSGTGMPVGTQFDNLGVSAKEHGIIAQGGNVANVIYPAFSLSGDYLLQAEFDLYGQHYSCLQKIQVRAPGIRAEACWDKESSGADHADMDLHMAKVNGHSCARNGWAGVCPNQDCYYANCKNGGSGPAWFTPSGPNSCVGWGSTAPLTATSCGNPRLDRDIISCEPTQRNPNQTTFPQFCGSENINVDNPADGDKFAVGLRYFGGSPAVRSHVNIYCNGERVLTTGYNPLTNNDFPKLINDGGDDSGDLWKVGLITAKIQNGQLSCDVAPTKSQQPNPNSDGSNAYCVDSVATSADAVKLLAPGGSPPLDADAMCFH